MKNICLVGNPNTGKSSLFNILTPSHHHTGNWTGKTVKNEGSVFKYKDEKYSIVDLPGIYSLISESDEEIIATKYLLEEQYDLIVFVADAVNLERSIELFLEVYDVFPNIILGVNLIDEARKINLKINKEKLEEALGVPVIFLSTKTKEGVNELLDTIYQYNNRDYIEILHTKKLQNYLDWARDKIPRNMLIYALFHDDYVPVNNNRRLSFFRHYISKMDVVESYHNCAKNIITNVLDSRNVKEKKSDKILNFLFSSKFTSIPILIVFLFFILWVSISFSNEPSNWLFSFFLKTEQPLIKVLSFIPEFIFNPLFYGGYRTLYWVISVMGPPTIIFFILFSLFEDYGLLPRIAFNLDYPFKKCGSCGKQGLTMCMGLGCNAVAVTGTRIMESKKIRILAILTNAFVPCNGRFPTIIVLLEIFLTSTLGINNSFWVALLLTLIVIFSIILTFISTKFISKKINVDEHVLFTLELPSFRRPKFYRTIYYAIKEKGIDVLKRAAIVSFPMGILIYLLSVWQVNGLSLFYLISNKLDYLGVLLGLDGIILLAFILGLPANEIILPIMLLGYLKCNTLVDYGTTDNLKMILINHGWTIKTAICFIFLMVCHYPCATTLFTIKQETKSFKLTFLAFILPLLVGLVGCLIINFLF